VDTYVRWVDSEDTVGGADGVIYTKLDRTQQGSSRILQQIAPVKIGELGTAITTIINEMTLTSVLDLDADLFRVNLYAQTPEHSVYEEFNETLYHFDGSVYVLATASQIVAGEDLYTYDGVSTYTPYEETVCFLFYEGISEPLMKRMAYVEVRSIEASMPYIINNITLNELGIPLTGILLELADSKLSEISDDIVDVIANATVADIIDWGNISGVDPMVEAALATVSVTEFFQGLIIYDADGNPLTTDDIYIAYLVAP
jgi:hypothetical protein